MTPLDAIVTYSAANTLSLGSTTLGAGEMRQHPPFPWALGSIGVLDSVYRVDSAIASKKQRHSKRLTSVGSQDQPLPSSHAQQER